MMNQAKKIDSGKLFFALAVAFSALAAAIIIGLVLQKPESTRGYGGAYVPRSAFLSGNSTVPAGNSTTPSTATSSPVLIKNASVETATTTLVLNMAGANGYDLLMQYFATNTPITINMTVEYSDNTVFSCDTGNSNRCDWYSLVIPSSSVVSSTSPDSVLGYQNSTYSVSSTTAQTNWPKVIQIPTVVRSATTSLMVAGPRDIFHRWIRLGFKPSDGATMNLWVQAVIREPNPTR